jgi:hypothetical protein
MSAVSQISMQKLPESPLQQTKDQLENTASLSSHQNVDLTSNPVARSTEKIGKIFDSALKNIDQTNKPIDSRTITQSVSNFENQSGNQPILRSFYKSPHFDMNVLTHIGLENLLGLLESEIMFPLLQENSKKASNELESFLKTQSKQDLSDFFWKIAREKKYPMLFKAITLSAEFSKISILSLNIALELATNENIIENVKILVESSRFNEIHERTLRIAFKTAVQSRFIEIIKILSKSSRFNIIAEEIFQYPTPADIFRHSIDAFQITAETNCLEMMNAMTNSSLFMDIHENMLIHHFMLAIELGRTETLKALVSSSRFSEIPIEYLNSAFKFAVENNSIETINALIQSPRFSKIPTKALQDTFEIAIQKGNKITLGFLIKIPRSDEVSKETLETASRIAQSSSSDQLSEESKHANAP